MLQSGAFNRPRPQVHFAEKVKLGRSVTRLRCRSREALKDGSYTKDEYMELARHGSFREDIHKVRLFCSSAGRSLQLLLLCLLERTMEDSG